MPGIRYEKLQDLDDETEIHQPKETSSVRLSIVAFLLLFGFISATIFLTSVPSNGMSRTVIGSRSLEETSQRPVLKSTSKSKRNITRWVDYYFTQEESEFLNCSALLPANKDSIDQYVTHGRMKLDKERLFELPMDCPSIRQRIHGDMPSFKPLKRPIAILRTVYNIYELQEAFLSISYHPDNTFCFAIDSKSTEKMKTSVRKLDDCFENVIVLEKEYNFDGKGHGQDPAHFDCLQRIMDRKWNHAVLLQVTLSTSFFSSLKLLFQNFDLVIKTPYQLSDLSELLNYTSVMGFDFGFGDRYNQTADWTPAGIKLFKSETGVPDKILHSKLRIRKGLNEVIVSKVFVKSIFEKLNVDRIIKLFNENNYYGVDEMLINTLYENNLGLDGQLEANCSRNHRDVLSRLTHWNYNGPNGFTRTCLSHFKRHGICVLGVEYLKELSESNYVTGLLLETTIYISIFTLS
ncbi:hypothetical protein CAEBREN_30130 [Caenorhabditis brenneri]|uniref:Uncharacterized protein n=1 Tax=Caenorhabditis brenneri TaxID=135651 RepID=G0NGU1_CAEBE|nr:hypothetical protein CAEBREN_30130 [Caenorhabditis brenneri]